MSQSILYAFEFVLGSGIEGYSTKISVTIKVILIYKLESNGEIMINWKIKACSNRVSSE